MQVVNHFDRELDGLTEQQKNQVVAILLAFASNIRGILREQGARFFEACPDAKPICDSCVLNHSTTFKGPQREAYGPRRHRKFRRWAF